MKPSGARKGAKRSAATTDLKGSIPIPRENEELIALLDAGKVDEFRRRMQEIRERNRKELFNRVLSGS